MSFAIITDSTSDISPARAQELGIYVIPLHVIIEGEDLLDQVQTSSRRSLFHRNLEAVHLGRGQKD